MSGGKPSRRRVLALGGAGAISAAGLLGAAGEASAVGEASAATAWKRLVVVTANVGRANLGQRERAIRDVRDAVTIDGARTTPLVGWQEIGEGDGDGREPGWIERHFAAGYRNLYLRHSVAERVPISVPPAYRVLQQRVTRVHGGKAGVSPHRVITEAVLERVDTPGLRFVLANTHYVAGAWNGREDPHEGWRDDMWGRHFRAHRDDVLGHWRSLGYPVIWTGDVNRTPMPLLLPNHEKRAFGGGIDQIGWVPGTNGTQLRLRWTKVVPMHVDGHDARVAVLQVRKV
ncbi:hypothetical protein FH609_028560 [Streptomyces sp. 3MP-14]|uniref:Endonuclease/exonuclease/phosphatase domain-containing protein n=1 Tax=Streptomyces mimosae TaxID=2586635 RepID=A0A5N5ZUL6_9ACTN|nr:MULTISPECIES: hypothetical protein [Streptomyces]KAB8159543.1 hypothetical protein FH607_028040 [Streptomyces mimosae]KAB8172821.1 hypothetical protein FH609_028560 [Streptomyces sp. 3MP-14]